MGAAAAVLGPGPAGVGPSSSSELFRSIAAVTLGRDAEKFWEGGTYSGRQRYMSMHMCMHMYVQYVQSLADCSHGDSHVGSVSPAATRTHPHPYPHPHPHPHPHPVTLALPHPHALRYLGATSCPPDHTCGHPLPQVCPKGRLNGVYRLTVHVCHAFCSRVQATSTALFFGAELETRQGGSHMIECLPGAHRPGSGWGCSVLEFPARPTM